MRQTAIFAAILFMLVAAADSWANDSQLARSIERGIVAYGRQPAQIADAAMSIVAPR